MHILEQIPLQSYNSFGIRATAQFFSEFSSPEEGVETAKYFKKMKLNPLILGGGSNVLLTKNPEAVLKNNIRGVRFEERGEEVLLYAGSGENWHEVVMMAVERNLGGIENLSLIPGTIGAAPMQNIGAYGVELTDVFDHLKAIHLESGEMHEFNKQDCRFGYRNSVFKHSLKGQYIISEVVLRLQKHPVLNTSYWALKETLEQMQISELSVRTVSDAVIAVRKSKLPDPAVLGNAGSFFKNPLVPAEKAEQLKEQYPEMPTFPGESGMIKVPAAWLIEKAGWKGKRVGNTGSHEKQALVLVNYGEATGNEIRNLAMNIIEDVHHKFGISLDPEVNIIE